MLEASKVLLVFLISTSYPFFLFSFFMLNESLQQRVTYNITYKPNITILQRRYPEEQYLTVPGP